MSLWRYFTRIIPAVSLFALAVLLIFAFVLDPPGKGLRQDKASFSQLLLSLYALVLHILSLVFPIRAFFALGHVVKKTRETAESSHEDEISAGDKARREHCAADEANGGLRFAIIIPTYQEDIETLSNTLRVLAAHPQAPVSYHVGSSLSCTSVGA